MILRRLVACVLLLSAAALGLYWLSRPRVLQAGTAPAWEVLPRDPTEPAFTLFALGGLAEPSRARTSLLEALGQRAQLESLDAHLLLGDFYGHRASSELLRHPVDVLLDAFPDSLCASPIYPVLGKLEARMHADLWQTESPMDRSWRMPGRWYSFQAPMGLEAQAEVFALDTEALLSGGPAAQDQLRWLADALRTSQAQVRIAFGYHLLGQAAEEPSKPGLAELLVPLFRDHGVKLYLAGAAHHMAVMRPAAGLTQVGAGSSARAEDVRWTARTLFCTAQAGAAYVRLGPAALRIELLDRNGEVLFATSVE